MNPDPTPFPGRGNTVEGNPETGRKILPSLPGEDHPGDPRGRGKDKGALEGQVVHQVRLAAREEPFPLPFRCCQAGLPHQTSSPRTASDRTSGIV